MGGSRVSLLRDVSCLLQSSRGNFRKSCILQICGGNILKIETAFFTNK